MRNSHQISREATSMLVMGFSLRASASLLRVWYCCFLFFAALSPWSSDTEAEIGAVHPSEVCAMVLLWTCTSSPAQSGTVQGWHIRNAAIHARARQLVLSRGPLACAVRSSGEHPAVVPPLKGEL